MRQETKRMLTVTGLYALMPLLLILIPKLFAGAKLEAYGAAYNAYMVLMEFGVIALPALIWLLTPQGRPAAKDFWRAKPTGAILLVIPLAICAYFCVNGVTVAWFILLQQFGITQMPQTVPAPQSGAQMAIGLAVISLTPALCEEFFFRGVLQPALHRNVKPWMAIVLGGCLFALVHGQLIAMPAHMLLGIGLCLVAYWTRSVWYTALWHVMQNGIAVALSFFSENALQATGAADESMALLTQQPLLMLISAGSMILMFGVGAAVFLILLYFTTQKHRTQPVVCNAAEERAQGYAYAPLILAAAAILYLYVTGTMMLMGGGA